MEDEFDLGIGPLVGRGAVAVESDDGEMVGVEVRAGGVSVETDMGGARCLEGTTVCVEVVEIEDEDEDEDVAGENDLRTCGDGEGEGME